MTGQQQSQHTVSKSLAIVIPKDFPFGDVLVDPEETRLTAEKKATYTTMDPHMGTGPKGLGPFLSIIYIVFLV